MAVYLWNLIGYNTAMKTGYADIVYESSYTLFKSICEQECNLTQKVDEIDSFVNKLMRRIGFQVVTMLLAQLSDQVIQEAKSKGFVVHRRKRVEYLSLFGAIEVESPYLWNKKIGKGQRPVKEKLGIEHGHHSIAVKRALTDFGCEESFGQAAKRFEEHYGWSIERGKARRLVENIAQQAEQYVEQRLTAEVIKSQQQPNNTCYKMLVELDGSHIRTGVKKNLESAQLTPLRQLKKCSRQIDWREVRVGFARPVDQKTSKTFVARMDKYPVVVQQLKCAAYSQGLTEKSQVYAVADGGNGLREALKTQFPNLRFILDYAHVKQHLYQGAEALTFTGKYRHIWVSYILSLVELGKTKKAIRSIKRYQNKAKDTQALENLCNYLERFSDATYYQLFRYWGLPIGSGEIESAHRYIPQKRLKIPGATWHPTTINPMLALRVIRANNWWDDFWIQINSCTSN